MMGDPVGTEALPLFAETENRDAILDGHERNRDADLEVIRRRLRQLARHKPFVSANDFGRILKDEGLPRGNWLGSVFRPREWVSDGSTIKSTTEGRHASRILTWRLAA